MLDYLRRNLLCKLIKKMILSPFSAIISFLFPQKIDTEANKVDNSRKTEREEFEDNLKNMERMIFILIQ